MAAVGVICSDTTDPYNSGDQDIIDRLDTTLGHTMSFLNSVDEATVSQADVESFVSANSLALVVILSSVTLSHIADDVFANVTVPVLHLEGWLWDNEEFCSGSNGETSSTHTQVTIVDQSHEMAGGLSGDVTFLSSARKMNYLKSSSAAAGVGAVADVKGKTGYHCVWAVETGGTLDDGTTAAARRAGFPFIYDASPVAHANAWTMFDAAVSWLLVDETTTVNLSATCHMGHVDEGQAIADSGETAPTLLVEMAFGVDWDTEPTAVQWTDLTSEVRRADRVTITRGRNDDLGVTEAGTAAFTLDNTDRAFEPGYVSGTYYPDVRPRTHVRIRADWHGVKWPMFRGFVERFDPSYPQHGKDAVCDVFCVDIYGIAASSHVDGGYHSTYITDAATGSRHWPLDEQSGNYGREILNGTTNSIWIADKTLGDSTFASSGVSRRQYGLKETLAQAWQNPAGEDLGTSGELTFMCWLRSTGTSGGGTTPTATFGSATETEEGTTNSPTNPTHASGDMLVAFFVWDASGSSNETAPSGWTQLGSTLDTNDGATSTKMAIYHKTAASASETAPTLTLDNNEDIAGWVVTVSGSDGTIHASTLQAQVTDETAPAVVTTIANCLILKALGADGSDAPFTWASSTERIDGETVASAIAYSGAESTQASAGTHAAEAVTYDATPPTYSTFATLAFAPEGGFILASIRNTAQTRFTFKAEVDGGGGITVDWTNDGTTAGAVSVAGSSSLMDGNWHHVAITRSGSGTAWTVDAYVDGVSVGSVTGPVETPWAGPSDVESFGWNFVGNMGEISYLYEALSDVAIAEVYQSYLDTFPQQATDERIEQVLSGYMNLPAGLQNLSSGLSTMPSKALNGSKVADVIDEAAVAEYGLFFIDGNGDAVFHPRSKRKSTNTTLDIGEGTSYPFTEIEFTNPDDHLVNVVVGNIDEGADSVAATDSTSVNKYGERRVEYALELISTQIAQAFVDHVLAQRKDDTMRVDAVELVATRATFLELLQKELSDRVNVNVDPLDVSGASADIDLNGYIERVAWSIDKTEWRTQWRLSPAALSETSF